MLGVSDEKQIVEKLWRSVEAAFELPPHMAANFFSPTGPIPAHPESRRGYQRYFLRDRAILKSGEKLFGIFTMDISRRGIGFLSPKQLMPKENIQLILTNGRKYHMLVTRCRRKGMNYFECGAKFTPVSQS